MMTIMNTGNSISVTGHDCGEKALPAPLSEVGRPETSDSHVIGSEPDEEKLKLQRYAGRWMWG